MSDTTSESPFELDSSGSWIFQRWFERPHFSEKCSCGRKDFTGKVHWDPDSDSVCIPVFGQDQECGLYPLKNAEAAHARIMNFAMAFQSYVLSTVDNSTDVPPYLRERLSSAKGVLKVHVWPIVLDVVANAEVGSLFWAASQTMCPCSSAHQKRYEGLGEICWIVELAPMVVVENSNQMAWHNHCFRTPLTDGITREEECFKLAPPQESSVAPAAPSVVSAEPEQPFGAADPDPLEDDHLISLDNILDFCESYESELTSSTSKDAPQQQQTAGASLEQWTSLKAHEERRPPVHVPDATRKPATLPVSNPSSATVSSSSSSSLDPVCRDGQWAKQSHAPGALLSPSSTTSISSLSSSVDLPEVQTVSEPEADKCEKTPSCGGPGSAIDGPLSNDAKSSYEAASTEEAKVANETLTVQAEPDKERLAGTEDKEEKGFVQSSHASPCSSTESPPTTPALPTMPSSPEHAVEQALSVSHDVITEKDAMTCDVAPVVATVVLAGAALAAGTETSVADGKGDEALLITEMETSTPPLSRQSKHKSKKRHHRKVDAHEDVQDSGSSRSDKRKKNKKNKKKCKEEEEEERREEKKKEKKEKKEKKKKSDKDRKRKRETSEDGEASKPVIVHMKTGSSIPLSSISAKVAPTPFGLPAAKRLCVDHDASRMWEDFFSDTC